MRQKTSFDEFVLICYSVILSEHILSNFSLFLIKPFYTGGEGGGVEQDQNSKHRKDLMDLSSQFNSLCSNTFLDKSLPMHLLWDYHVAQLMVCFQGLLVVDKQRVWLTLRC